jgi:histidine ammonia-lyase
MSLEQVHTEIRAQVPFYDADRYFSPDIEAAKTLVKAGRLSSFVNRLLPSRIDA